MARKKYLHIHICKCTYNKPYVYVCILCMYIPYMCKDVRYAVCMLNKIFSTTTAKELIFWRTHLKAPNVAFICMYWPCHVRTMPCYYFFRLFHCIPAGLSFYSVLCWALVTNQTLVTTNNSTMQENNKRKT